MTKFLALNISVFEDGFMAGPNQPVDSPLGTNGELLHSWAFATQAFKKWHGESGGATGIDLCIGTTFLFIREGVDRAIQLARETVTAPIISESVVHQTYVRK